MEWEKTFANHISYKVSISKIYWELEIKYPSSEMLGTKNVSDFKFFTFCNIFIYIMRFSETEHKTKHKIYLYHMNLIQIV
jgi:hypothetical protein